MTSNSNKRPYGRINENKLITSLAQGKTKTEAGIIAGSQAQRHNIPDVVNKKSENVGFKEKLEEHVKLLQSYITEDKIAEEDVKSLVWMLDKLCRILIITNGGIQTNNKPIPIYGGASLGKMVVLPSEIYNKYTDEFEKTSEELNDPYILLEHLKKKLDVE